MANERSIYMTDSRVFSLCKKAIFIAYIMKIGTMEMKSVEMIDYVRKGRGRM